MPKISVIVPVYNVEQYIHRCIDSILGQTFTDFELILVDDDSPDNCGKICDEYAKRDNRVIVIHQENGGASAARNTGIDWAFNNSNSEWITFVDSDDFVHKQFFEILLNAAYENNSEIISCFFEKVYDSDFVGKPINSFSVKTGTAENILINYKTYTKFNLTTIWGRLYKKNCFNGVRFPVGVCREDEYVTYKVVFQCEKLAVVESVLYYYLQNPTGAMQLPLSVKKISDWFTAYEQQMEYYYTNGSKLLFQSVFSTYVSMLTGFYYEYCEYEDFKKEITKRTGIIYNTAKSHKSYLPENTNIKKLKNICKSIDRRIILNDYKEVKQKNGIIRSFFFIIKHILLKKP